MRSPPAVLAALPALGIAWLLPRTGLGLYLRLGAATGVVLLPGALIAGALGFAAIAPLLAWALGAVALALGVTFVVHGTIWIAVVVLAVVAIAALRFTRRSMPSPLMPGGGIVLLAGIAFGIALWHVAQPLDGDPLFHLARVRKLAELGDLSLHRVDEFKDGGLHPGYAFPLWHGFLALVAKLGGVDSAQVVRHEASVLAPLAVLLAYEAGTVLFGSRWLGGSVAGAQLAMIALAPGHGGAYGSLALPATASRQLLAMAALALAFRAAAEPSPAVLASLAAAAVALALVHATYALFLLVPVAGWLVVRAVLEPRDWRRPALVLVALGAPALATLGALYPVAQQAASVHASRSTRCGTHHGVARYASQLDVHSCTSFSLKPELLSRMGAVAIAALLLVPLAALAWRRRWASFVLGGSLVVLVLVLTPFLFAPFADAVSLSQARRLAGFIPFAFAFAGGIAVLARFLRILVVPVALAAGIVLQLAWPGDFGYRFGHDVPAFPAWVALVTGGAALLGVAVFRRPRLEEDGGWIAATAALLFLVPVAVHGFRSWSPPRPTSTQKLTPGLVHALRTDVRPGDVVFSDPETSYRILAAAPVYVAAAPPTHVADTRANHPYRRAADAVRFFRDGDLAIPRRVGADWLVLYRPVSRLHPPLRRIYGDSHYTLYALR